uniref:Uncharacterized protein n=1 Tax=Brassica oleracea TaxID=3712 RepID=A0A3P6B9U8_BRAOL|nr:unnamed protein product [Brassica oleracea]
MVMLASRVFHGHTRGIQRCLSQVFTLHQGIQCPFILTGPSQWHPRINLHHL